MINKYKITSYISAFGVKVYELNKRIGKEWYIVGDSTTNKAYLENYLTLKQLRGGK